MKLQNLIAAIAPLEVRGTLPEAISGLQYHSGKVEGGQLFFCIKGYITDGHQFLPMAVEKGATVAVVEDFQPVDVPQIRVADSRLAMALMADAYYGHPSKRLRAVGVTASNGKTSTSFMINEIFKAHQLKTGIIGTVMTQYGDTLIPSELTTPESLDLHGYFADMVKQQVTHVTMEVSSSGQELSRVGGVDFDVVTFNNITKEHIDQHGSFESYLFHKTKLIKNAKPEAYAILNLDDPYSKALITETKATVVTYGAKDQSGDIALERLDLSSGRANMTIVINRMLFTPYGQVAPCRFEISLGVAGYHSAINALAAIGVALVLGLPIDAIQKGLSAYRGVERRFEVLFEDDFKIFDDHFANGGNIDVTLESISLMDYKKLVLVYAIRGCRGTTTNQENAETIAKWAKTLGLQRIIATKSVGHVGKKDMVLPEELAVFEQEMAAAGIEVELHEGLQEAIASGLKQVAAGDVLLLAGCQGMDHGGRIALTQLQALRPELRQRDLLAVLGERVCGMTPQPCEVKP